MSGSAAAAPMSAAQEKEQRCVSTASTTMYTWAAAMVPMWIGVWAVGARFSPSISKMNWRIKAVGSSVSTIALSYYKAERALIDCNQEYDLRARDNRNKARAEERAKRAAMQQQQLQQQQQQQEAPVPAQQ